MTPGKHDLRKRRNHKVRCLVRRLRYFFMSVIVIMWYQVLFPPLCAMSSRFIPKFLLACSKLPKGFENTSVPLATNRCAQSIWIKNSVVHQKNIALALTTYKPEAIWLGDEIEVGSWQAYCHELIVDHDQTSMMFPDVEKLIEEASTTISHYFFTMQQLACAYDNQDQLQQSNIDPFMLEELSNTLKKILVDTFFPVMSHLVEQLEAAFYAIHEHILYHSLQKTNLDAALQAAMMAQQIGEKIEQFIHYYDHAGWQDFWRSELRVNLAQDIETLVDGLVELKLILKKMQKYDGDEAILLHAVNDFVMTVFELVSTTKDKITVFLMTDMLN